MKSNVLWNRNYKLFTISDFIEEMSYTGINFAVSLFVLEFSNSVLLYGIYLALNYVSCIFLPALIGPLVEKSKKKNINIICCSIMVLIYTVYLLLNINGYNNMIYTATLAVLSGALQTTYMISKTSLLPRLIDEEYIQKSASINNGIETTCAIANPLATFLYETIGLVPILIACIALFVISSILIVFINEPTKEYVINDNYSNSLKDGISFFRNNLLFLFLTLIFVVKYIKLGADQAIYLPYFKDNVTNGYFWYFIVVGGDSTGIFHASFLMYFLKIKKSQRRLVSTVCLTLMGIASIFTLNANYIIAIIASYIVGLTFGIYNNLRLTIMYENLDKTQISRYISIFTSLTNAGKTLGTVLAGLLSQHLSLIRINVVFSIIMLLVCIYLQNRKELKDLYIC